MKAEAGDLAGLSAPCPSRAEPAPVRRRLVTLFVDIAGSTSLLVHHPPETVLSVVQGFMTLVTELAFAHAGTVKDFEGDGALVYFASVKNAVGTALAIQKRLAEGHCNTACREGPGISARMSLTVGDVVVGTVGSTARRGLALIGPSVNIGARLLKHAPLGAIVASGEVVEELRSRNAKDLVDRFSLLDTAFLVPGADGMTIATYVVPPQPGDAIADPTARCCEGLAPRAGLELATS